MFFFSIAVLIAVGIWWLRRHLDVGRATTSILRFIQREGATDFISLHGRVIDSTTDRPFGPDVINRAVDQLQRCDYLESFSQGNRTCRLTDKGRASIRPSALPYVDA